MQYGRYGMSGWFIVCVAVCLGFWNTTSLFAESVEETAAQRRWQWVQALLQEGSRAEAQREFFRLQLDYPDFEPPTLPTELQRKKAPQKEPEQLLLAVRHPIQGRYQKPPRFQLCASFPRTVVSFYRAFISSAIGSRCVLEPSCSQYFLDASRRHGILGIPMTTDRFIREPVESHSPRWVERPNGERRHLDPVDAHDFWMKP